jgi:hypothetical protein
MNSWNIVAIDNVTVMDSYEWIGQHAFKVF